jgi:hypothetical protein
MIAIPRPTFFPDPVEAITAQSRTFGTVGDALSILGSKMKSLHAASVDCVNGLPIPMGTLGGLRPRWNSL